MRILFEDLLILICTLIYVGIGWYYTLYLMEDNQVLPVVLYLIGTYAGAVAWKFSCIKKQ